MGQTVNADMDWDSVCRKDHREMTKAECLFEIGARIGFRGHKRSTLRKYDLNSIYWYLEGEQAHHPIDFGTKRSPAKKDMLLAVAESVGFAYTPTHFRTWKEDIDARPLRVTELRSIVYALRESEDSRGHV